MRRLVFPLLFTPLLLASFLLAGCEENEVTYMSCGDVGGADVVEDVTAPPDVAPDVVDPGGDAGPVEKIVGGPCTADDECPSDWCATTESLSDLLRRDYEVPGGLCTVLFCEAGVDPGAAGGCGAEAACRDAGGLSLCAPTCESYADCRYSTGWACAGPDAGAPADGPAACLPQSGLAAARCGDGVCDEAERYDAEGCPLDCEAVPEPPYASGGPCDGNGDCVTDFCLTQAFLVPLFPGVEMDVPNGYCSSNPLANPCADDETCGEGGVCADASALAGMPVTLCLHACVTDADCRYDEGYRCFSTGEGDDAQRGCLPGSVIAAIRCGDGVCDPAEQANPEQCSEVDFQGDCP